jgi:hypothetical protein
LNQVCKSYEINKKSEKEKEKKQKKNRESQGETFQPNPEWSPRPISTPYRIGTTPSLPPADA